MKILKYAVCTLVLAALAGTSVSTCILYGKVKTLENERNRPAEAEKPRDNEAAPPDTPRETTADTAPGKASDEAKERKLEITNFTYGGGDQIVIWFSEMPDREVLRRYITAEPLANGAASLNFFPAWEYRIGKYVPKLTVRGDFEFRTNITLRVRKGLPAAKDAEVKPLAEDFTRTFVRDDRTPFANFADKGRYLPPSGPRALMLTSANTPSIHAEIRRIPSANIVHYLSLDTEAYGNIYRTYYYPGNEDKFAKDISGEPRKISIPAGTAPNVVEKTPFTLEIPDGGSPNGVFLVSVADEKESFFNHRVVCVSDIGISLRKDDKSLFVWATSLTTGKPIAEAKVEIYSPANILVAKGTTDAGGWCETERVCDGRPFAVVVSAKDSSDMSFMAIVDSTHVQEGSSESRREYLAPEETSAFVWTDRGIYRHGEKIFANAIIRNGEGVAPRKFPVEFSLVSPDGKTAMRETGLFADESGAVSCEGLSAAEELPSGTWRVKLSIPGAKGRAIGSRTIKIEEFAPPTVKVKAEPRRNSQADEFGFEVSAEHLYGGAATELRCEGAVCFADAPFAPDGWKGWKFGSGRRLLSTGLRKLAPAKLDDAGRHEFASPLTEKDGKPAAAVKAIVEGTVFEPGGRPATARGVATIHCYPFYIGTRGLEDWTGAADDELVSVKVACVSPDGKRLDETKRLVAKLEKKEFLYTYSPGENGWAAWKTETVLDTLAENIPVEVPAGSDAEFAIPFSARGDLILTISDPETDVEFSKAFYLARGGESAVRAPLETPGKVAISTDKPFYRPGETPVLAVKAPFAGTALLAVMRDKLVFSRVIALTNATSEIELPPCEKSWAPNVDVRLSVVSGAAADAKGFALHVHGEATVSVRPAESEIPVSVAADAQNGGKTLEVSVDAPGASRVAVTVVDEGINLFTDEPVPDPVGFFATPGTSLLAHRLYGLYNSLLPVLGADALKASGVKTGGGAPAEMLGRVSPVASRRFAPLSLWRTIDIQATGGKAKASFDLPDFAGELRVTAVACSPSATGSASVRKKICPALVIEPDAPRFAAPGDRFAVTLPIDNRSGKDGDISYKISSGSEIASGEVHLAKDEKTVLKFYTTAPSAPGEMKIKFAAEGFGEKREKTILLPVRPAVAWRETAGVEILKPGEKFALPAQSATNKFRYVVQDTRSAELRAAYDWLAKYPYGCLEQTSSRIFPLLRTSLGDAQKRDDAIRAGVARVASMVRENDFSMWPDCNYTPWDREVSLYAAHFLAEAAKCGYGTMPDKVAAFLKKWAMSPTNSISAYACHTLALAGKPEKDRMFRLYDDRKNLDLLSRARLARAFTEIHDRKRSETLLANAPSPENVKEASFLLLALIGNDPDDKRIPPLAEYLLSNRDKRRFSWGTTGENAHALLALGAWFATMPPANGVHATREIDGFVVNEGTAPAFVSWAKLDLPSLADDKDESSDLEIRREYFTSDGHEYDLAKAKTKDCVHVRLTLKSNVERDYADLVIEDLLPAAFEPVLGEKRETNRDWVMRTDARDDRMLVFSKKFHMNKNDEVQIIYPVHIVSQGDFALPGVACEGMYHPSLRARARGGRLVVRD